MKWMRIFSLVVSFVVTIGSTYSFSEPQQQTGVIRYVNNKGVRIRYRVYGKGEPLVLIHGWPSEGLFWETFGYVSKLSQDYQLIVPDLRGFGGSSIPANGDFSDKAYASDVRAVMDDMGIRSANVFDFWITGYELAAGSPERVRSLIILGNHPYAMSEEAKLQKWGSGELNRRFWEDDNHVPLPAESRKRLLAWTPEQIRAVSPDKDDKSERLKAWKGPGLLIAGTKDDHMEGINRFIASSPNWKFVSIESVPLTHGQVWIRSDLTLPVVQNFLRSLPRSK